MLTGILICIVVVGVLLIHKHIPDYLVKLQDKIKSEWNSWTKK